MLPRRACFGVPCLTDTGAVGPGRGGLASATGLPRLFRASAVTVVATRRRGWRRIGGAGRRCCRRRPPGCGGGAAGVDGRRRRGNDARFCRAIEPVTESSPCSRTVTREYSRSRSPLRVSIADASRRVSFWLSLATDWICCACRVRSAAATCSLPQPDRGLVGVQRDRYRAHRDRAPGCRAVTANGGRNHPPRPKSPASTPPEFSVSKPPPRWIGMFCHSEFFGPPKARRITPRTLTGNAPAAGIRPLAGCRIGFPRRLKNSRACWF